jgi:nucleotide-binding universal stress UspA family protein
MMFKNILVAVDGSTHAKAAVEYGARLAAKLGARVELLHVIERRLLVGDFITHFTEVFRHKIDGSFAEWVERYYLEYGQGLVERARQHCLSLGATDCDVAVETGKAAKQIISHAKEADLLVMGQRGESEEHEVLFIGSVAARVLHDVKTTALVVQPPVREWRRALLAYDGTPAARRAMEILGNMAVTLKLQVDAVHWIEKDKDPNCLKEAEEYLSQLPVSYEIHYLRGDSHEVILQHASEKGCDLLAMGAFTNLISDALARGTATETILRLSQIPALIHR